MAAISLLIGAVWAGAGNAMTLGEMPFYQLEDYWNFSKELNEENADEYVQRHVDAGRTVFIRFVHSTEDYQSIRQSPAWNKVVKDFDGNTDVVFGDVMFEHYRVEEIGGEPVNGGEGGWPTIRHYNKKTGYGGQAYRKRTELDMCDELGSENPYMLMYVESKGRTSLCKIEDQANSCTEQQAKLIRKWSDKPKEELQKQIDRLKGMLQKEGSSMTVKVLTSTSQRLSAFRMLHKKAQKQRSSEDEL